MTTKKDARAYDAANQLPTQPPADAPKVKHALWHAEVGRIIGAYKVFLCVDDDKAPRYEGWQRSASWDRTKIETMWRNHPNANIGLAIQPGFIVIDTDIYKPGKEAALDRFEAEHG